MKILLINPPPYIHVEKNRYLERTPIQTYTLPLGIGYIASFLEKEGYHVRILDAYVNNLTPAEIEKYIKDFTPDVIGMLCLSDQRASWYKLIVLIREICQDIKIVLGGPHPTLMPEAVITHFHPDVIVVGEGEKTMLDLVKTFENKGNLSDVKGIAYMENGKVFVTPQRERIKDLDSLPFPARHLVDMNDYSGWGMMERVYPLLGLKKPPKYATMSTSRGCISNCGYCSTPHIWNRRWTQRSATNVVDEMEHLKNEYGIEFILLTDDIFTVNQKRVISICEEILKRKLNVLWAFETAVNLVSSELLLKANEAGCRIILYGIESGSKTVLSNIYKKTRMQDMEKAFRMTRDAGILSSAFLMVGNPGESEKSINETIRLLRKLKPDISFPQITMITPGTMIFNLAKEKGYIQDDFWLTNLPFPYYTCERNLRTLLRWFNKLSYYQHSDIGILLRTVRDYIEFHMGISIRRSGISKVEKPF